MSLKWNRTVIRKFVEALNTTNLSLLDNIIAPDYVDEQQQGPENAKQAMRMF